MGVGFMSCVVLSQSASIRVREDSMESQAIAAWITAGAAIVAAGATVVYTIGTFRLWRTTKESVEAMRDAFRLNFLMACREAGAPIHFSSSNFEELVRRFFPGEAESLTTAIKQRQAEDFESLILAMKKAATPKT
jgi:hypothetical protein